MRDPVKTEWRRLLARLRQRGPLETSALVSSLVRTKNYPVYYSYRFVKLMLRRREFEAAGNVLLANRQARVADPLIDDLYAAWLWAEGRKEEAFSFAKTKAARWSAPYLVHTLAAMYLLRHEDKKAEKYFRLAHSLADRELAAGHSRAFRIRMRKAKDKNTPKQWIRKSNNRKGEKGVKIKGS